MVYVHTHVICMFLMHGAGQQHAGFSIILRPLKTTAKNTIYLCMYSFYLSSWEKPCIKLQSSFEQNTMFHQIRSGTCRWILDRLLAVLIKHHSSCRSFQPVVVLPLLRCCQRLRETLRDFVLPFLFLMPPECQCTFNVHRGPSRQSNHSLRPTVHKPQVHFLTAQQSGIWFYKGGMSFMFSQNCQSWKSCEILYIPCKCSAVHRSHELLGCFNVTITMPLCNVIHWAVPPGAPCPQGQLASLILFDALQCINIWLKWNRQCYLHLDVSGIVQLKVTSIFCFGSIPMPPQRSSLIALSDEVKVLMHTAVIWRTTASNASWQNETRKTHANVAQKHQCRSEPHEITLVHM